MSKSAPLLQNADKALPPLYDPASMMNMDPELARGFIVLMGGKVEKNGKVSTPKPPGPGAVDEANATLGFLALTEGNTVEACFGVNAVTTGRQGRKQAQQVKVLLADAVDGNEDIRRLAVRTYQGAFRIVYRFGEKKRRLNVFTRCLCYRKMQEKAQKDLRENFQLLEEAVQATR